MKLVPYKTYYGFPGPVVQGLSKVPALADWINMILLPGGSYLMMSEALMVYRGLRKSRNSPTTSEN